MPWLIKDGAIVDDRWVLAAEADAPAVISTNACVIVPLAYWLAQRDTLITRGKVGVVLAPADDPATLADDVALLPLIAVSFPQFGDGRGYSTGRLLREAFAFTGELRAVGDVLRDQLFALRECGFDAFAVRADLDLEAALAAFREYDELYAPSVRQPLPWFRRRASASARLAVTHSTAHS